MKLDVILKILKRKLEKNPDGIGCDAQYYRISKGIGVKLYWYKTLRCTTYEAQKRVYDYGKRVGKQFAPKLGRKIDIETKDGMMYGYITQHCEVNPKRTRPYADDLEFSEEYEKLIEELHQHSIEIGDLHEFNIGYLRDKPIVIDFDWINWCPLA